MSINDTLYIISEQVANITVYPHSVPAVASINNGQGLGHIRRAPAVAINHNL